MATTGRTADAFAQFGGTRVTSRIAPAAGGAWTLSMARPFGQRRALARVETLRAARQLRRRRVTERRLVAAVALGDLGDLGDHGEGGLLGGRVGVLGARRARLGVRRLGAGVERRDGPGRARPLAAAIVERWWDEGRGLLADEDSRARFSEHAQCLALIADVLDAPRAARCVDAWLAADDLWPTSIYFSFYPLEALYRAGRGDALLRRLRFWAGLAGQGFTTPPEAPEPSRSDCHGWGSHPLWHWAASLAGIRPTAPGLERVAIAPCPGPLTRLAARIPHPRGGTIALEFARDGARWRARIELPAGVSGEFRFAGATRALAAGTTVIDG